MRRVWCRVSSAGVGRARLIRISIVAAAIATTGILVWGYIAHRYMTEFIPLLVVAGALGLVDVWSRVDGRSRRARNAVLVGVALLGVFGVLANRLISSAPTDPPAWERARVRNYVELQESISDGRLKRWFGLSDQAASRLLGKIGQFRRR